LIYIDELTKVKMPKKNIAILSGGWSREREISIKSGKAVYDALDKEKYSATVYDPRKDLNLLIKNRQSIELAFILLHGRFGEDGCIQGFLNLLNIPFVGSDVTASAMSSNKRLAKDMYKLAGLNIIKDVTIKRGRNFSVDQIIDLLGEKTIVKPLSEGSSFGISVCNNRNELQEGIESTFKYENEIMIEKFINGREVTCCVLGNDTLESLPIVEIIPNNGYKFFNYEAKYTKGATKEVCPADLPCDISEKVIEYAKTAHRVLQCRTWSRTDMIIQGKDIFILETNTIPGMTENSLVPLASRAAGISITSLLDRLIDLSLEKPAVSLV
jgi:D-alanine-D-alanine ligase